MNEATEVTLTHSEYERYYTIEAYTAASARHPGRNDDAWFATEQGSIGICDGLGRYENSARASQLVVDFCQHVLADVPDTLEPEVANDLMATALIEANHALEDVYSEYDRICTTAAIAKLFVHPDTRQMYVSIAHAGDSRIYVIRVRRRVAVTIDHNGATIEENDATRADIQHAISAARYEHEIEILYRSYLPWRNHVGSCLSNKPTQVMRVDTLEVNVQSGDVVLAISDGICDNLTDQEIITLINTGDASLLIEHAQKRSGEVRDEIYPIVNGHEVDSYNFRPNPDDMTVVALRIP